jgi:anion-transporting  ArsA/GET3 family ATPase
VGPDTQLIVVSGKGGVGKTVIAAAIARALVARGRRVLVLEADPRENLHHLVGAEPSGGAVVRVDERLALQNANPRTIVDAVVKDRLKIGALSRRVLASPVYQHFAEGAPGLKEMMLLGYALQVAEGEAKHRADVVVLDAPASGHGLTLLAAPLLVAEVIGGGPLGTMARRISGLVADTARSSIVLATLAEEMPVQETLETAAQVEARLARPVSWMVCNAVYPPLPPDDGERGSGGPAAEAVALWRTRRRLNEAELERLSAGWRGPLATLPLVAEEFGPGLLAALRPELERQWPGGAPEPRGRPRRRKRRA